MQSIEIFTIEASDWILTITITRNELLGAELLDWFSLRLRSKCQSRQLITLASHETYIYCHANAPNLSKLSSIRLLRHFIDLHRPFYRYIYWSIMNSSELPLCERINFNSTIAAGATAAASAVGIDVVRACWRKLFFANVSERNCLTLCEVWAPNSIVIYMHGKNIELRDLCCGASEESLGFETTLSVRKKWAECLWRDSHLANHIQINANG